MTAARVFLKHAKELRIHASRAQRRSIIGVWRSHARGPASGEALTASTQNAPASLVGRMRPTWVTSTAVLGAFQESIFDTSNTAPDRRQHGHAEYRHEGRLLAASRTCGKTLLTM